MLRTVGDQPGLWESILPRALLVLPEQLARVDELLDYPAFFAPLCRFSVRGWGVHPLQWRPICGLMFLKFRYGLGYKALCREVPIRSPGDGFAGSGCRGRCRIRRP